MWREKGCSTTDFSVREKDNITMGVKDWADEKRVWNALAAVRNVQVQPSGPKGPLLTAILFDATGERKAKCWELPAAQWEKIQEIVTQEPPLLRVSGTLETTGKYAGELTITGVTSASDDDFERDPSEFLPPPPPGHEELVAGLDRLIRRVKNKHLAALLAGTLGRQGCLREAYVMASAARTNHHAYPGGLLRHSLEVTDFALQTVHRYPGIRPDVITCAGLLHDMGKLWEMNHSWRRGEYTDAGTLCGHIFLGANRLEKMCRKLGFPDGLREQLIHAVLAHHDELQYGSPVRPATA